MKKIDDDVTSGMADVDGSVFSIMRVSIEAAAVSFFDKYVKWDGGCNCGCGNVEARSHSLNNSNNVVLL